MLIAEAETFVHCAKTNRKNGAPGTKTMNRASKHPDHYIRMNRREQWHVGTHLRPAGTPPRPWCTLGSRNDGAPPRAFRSAARAPLPHSEEHLVRTGRLSTGDSAFRPRLRRLVDPRGAGGACRWAAPTPLPVVWFVWVDSRQRCRMHRRPPRGRVAERERRGDDKLN